MNRWLLIDDIRTLNVDVIARTAEEGRGLLQGEAWACVCLDHDLGTPETGYDVLVWALEQNCLPPRVQLVTANPVGRLNMQRALRHAGYESRNGVEWLKEA